MNKENRFLIVVDLDGTLLSTESRRGEWNVSEKNKEVLKKVMKLGHKVAIVTGRPWRDTKDIYKQLGLNTIVANYNGAEIHHPLDKGFITHRSTINREFYRELISLPTLKKCLENIVIEGIDDTLMLNKNDPDLVTGFHLEDKIKEISIDDDLKEDPFTILIKLTNKISSEQRRGIYLEIKRKFNSAFLVRYWGGEFSELQTLEINGKSITKGYALDFISSYYNIPKHKTIAFGDGLNDIEMLQQATLGVAMKNSRLAVKTYGNDETDFTNDKDGVGKYLEKYFNLK